TTRWAATSCRFSPAPRFPSAPRPACFRSSMGKGKPSIAVSESRGVRTLHVGGEAIQSSMRLEDPYALALDYTRCMMGFMLFHPEPREALMIGLGGGSLVKFFHRNLRKTKVHVVEVDELVVAAFEDELHVPQLASAEFYDGAFLALREPGALVVNFMDDDPKFDATLQRLERAFGGAVIVMPALYDPNILAFALKGIPRSIEWRVLRSRAEDLEPRLGLPFTRYVSRLRAMNRWTASDLIISP